MNSTIINNIIHDVISELNNEFNSISNYDISVVANSIDEYIISLINNILWSNTSHIILNSKRSSDYVNEFVIIENQPYVLNVQQPLHESNALEIGYINLKHPNKSSLNNKIVTIELVGIGKFKKMYLFFPKSAKIDTDLIQELLKKIVKVAYNWLWRRIKRNINNNYIVDSNLYETLKLSLTDKEEISNSVWFVIQYKKTCYLILEKENIKQALNKLDSEIIHPDLSSYNLLDNLINMRLKYEQSFALQATRAGKCIDGVIDRGNYTENLPLLVKSQQNVFTNQVSVYPIKTTGKYHLFASFPTEFRSTIEPVLDINSKVIIKDFNAMYSRWRQIIKSINSNFNNNPKLIDKIVYQSGNFLGAFYSSVSKT